MPINKDKLVTKAQRTEEEFNTLALRFRVAIQAKLDSAAQAKGYDSIATAVSYAEEPAVPRFQEEGQALRQWRSLVWQYAYQELDKVKSGARATPSVEEFLSEMPQL